MKSGERWCEIRKVGRGISEAIYAVDATVRDEFEGSTSTTNLPDFVGLDVDVTLERIRLQLCFSLSSQFLPSTRHPALKFLCFAASQVLLAVFPGCSCGFSKDLYCGGKIVPKPKYSIYWDNGACHSRNVEVCQRPSGYPRVCCILECSIR